MIKRNWRNFDDQETNLALVNWSLLCVRGFRSKGSLSDAVKDNKQAFTILSHFVFRSTYQFMSTPNHATPFNEGTVKMIFSSLLKYIRSYGNISNSMHLSIAIIDQGPLVQLFILSYYTALLEPLWPETKQKRIHVISRYCWSVVMVYTFKFASFLILSSMKIEEAEFHGSYTYYWNICAKTFFM